MAFTMVNQEVQHWELRMDHGQATLVNILNQYQATTILNLALALICQRAQQGQSHKRLEMSKFWEFFASFEILRKIFSNIWDLWNILVMLCHWICRNHLALHHLVSGKCQIHHRTITSQRLPVTMLLEMMIFPIIHKSYHHNRDKIWATYKIYFSNICTNLSLFSLLFWPYIILCGKTGGQHS